MSASVCLVAILLAQLIVAKEYCIFIACHSYRSQGHKAINTNDNSSCPLGCYRFVLQFYRSYLFLRSIYFFQKVIKDRACRADFEGHKSQLDDVFGGGGVRKICVVLEKLFRSEAGNISYTKTVYFHPDVLLCTLLSYIDKNY